MTQEKADEITTPKGDSPANRNKMDMTFKELKMDNGIADDRSDSFFDVSP